MVYRFDLEIPDDRVRRTYRFPHVFEQLETDHVFDPYAWSEDKLSLTRRVKLPYNPFYPGYVVATAARGKRLYATTRTLCGEYRVTVWPDYVEPRGRRKTRMMRSMEQDTERVAKPMVPAHTPITDEQGEPLGEVRLPMSLQEMETRAQGDRLCVTQPVWRDETAKDTPPGWSFTWCVARKQVQRDDDARTAQTP